MKKKSRHRWINILALLGVLMALTVAGLYQWDAKNYPIFEVLEDRGADPFADPPTELNWKFDNSLVKNLVKIQKTLRNRKKDRQNRASLALLLSQITESGSYWALPQKRAIRFGENGIFETRRGAGENESPLDKFSHFRVIRNCTILLSNQKESATYKFDSVFPGTISLEGSSGDSYEFECDLTRESFNSFPANSNR